MPRDRSALDVTDFLITNTEIADKVSANFTVREIVYSELAIRRDIQNWFVEDAHLQSAVRLCREVLQPLRDRFWPFTPNSVYRSQELERKLKNKPPKWVSKSQHTRGEAADIEIPGLSNLDLAKWIRDHLTFDQLIAEFYTAGQPDSGWVHVSLKGSGNRSQCLTFDGKAYTDDLPE